ncbi:hypothetical protein [Mesobacterium pallidum]|uniref:hypothetical protein n=1 Tax=Mesobacterium pallidum TaxID=2872037 RepID=UPI001EE322C7|nr:hypothetical protein [Mesobacterium pallidum]
MSALGIIHGFGAQVGMVAARPLDEDAVIGSAIGSVLDADIIDRYGLADYGARPGDGLLGFIGIVPHAQGRRYRPADAELLHPDPGGASLARLLFDAWLRQVGDRSCERLFIRTRPRIGQVQHLSESFGFELCGRFEVEFHGERQTRLVYCRDARRGARP